MAHNCEGESPRNLCGEAITYCVERDTGEFWAGNNEYESRVNYCPHCGEKAPRPTHYAKFSCNQRVLLQTKDRLLKATVEFISKITEDGVFYNLYLEEGFLSDVPDEDVPEEKLVPVEAVR